MKLSLNHESAAALRDFAEAMPVAIESIRADTDRLVQVYESVADRVGEHETDFFNMLMLIKTAQTDASDALQELPKLMIETADKIDDYVAKRAEIGGN